MYCPVFPAASVALATRLSTPSTSAEVVNDQGEFAVVVPNEVVPLKTSTVDSVSASPEIVSILLLVR